MPTLKTEPSATGRPIPYKLIYDWLDQGLNDLDYVKEYKESVAAAEKMLDPRAARSILSKVDLGRAAVATLATQSDMLYGAMNLAKRRDFVFAAQLMQRLFGLSPDNPSQTTAMKPAYMLAQSMFEAQQHVWVLDDETMDALTETKIPKALVADRLPYLPFSTMLIVLPPGKTIEVNVGIIRDRDATIDEMEEPAEGMFRASKSQYERELKLQLTSLLIYEEIPGVKWRYLGIQDRTKYEKIAFNDGWLDISFGNAVDLMPHYAPTGDNACWQLMINLFMVLEHGDYLRGQPIIVPPAPPKRGKKQRMQDRQSRLDYTVINLGRRAFDERDEVEEKARVEPSGRSAPYQHEVKGFFKGVWVRDPERRSTRGERVNPHGNTVYRVSTWIPPYTRGDPTKATPASAKRREVKVTRRRRRRR